MSEYEELKRTMLNNPGASDWLKAATVSLENRDPIDAMGDAAYLAKLAKMRADEVLAAAQEVRFTNVYYLTNG